MNRRVDSKILCIAMLFCIVISGDCLGQSSCPDGTCGAAMVPLPRVKSVVQKSINAIRPQRQIASPPPVVHVYSIFQNRKACTTGTLLRGGFVVTCAHGLKHGWEIVVEFSDGAKAKVVDSIIDGPRDLAILKLHTNDHRGRQFLKCHSPPKVGTRVGLGGFGQHDQPYYAVGGVVIGYENDQIIVKPDRIVRQGDSGGPIYLPNGGIVGIISEATKDPGEPYWKVFGANTVAIVEFTDKLHAKVYGTKQVPPAKADPVDIVLPPDVDDSGPTVCLPPTKPVVKPTVCLPPTKPTPADPAKKPEDKSTDADLPTKSVIVPSVDSDKKQGDGVTKKQGGSVLDIGTAIVGDAATSYSAWMALAAVLGFSGPVGIGLAIGGWLISKQLRRKVAGRSAVVVEDGTADTPFQGSRDTTEAKEYLRLAQLEGRSPVLDALVGRVAMDRLDQAVESDPSSDEAKWADRFRQYIRSKVEQMAPLAINATAS